MNIDFLELSGLQDGSKDSYLTSTAIKDELNKIRLEIFTLQGLSHICLGACIVTFDSKFDRMRLNLAIMAALIRFTKEYNSQFVEKYGVPSGFQLSDEILIGEVNKCLSALGY